MNAAPQGIEARVRALAEEVTSRAGYELVDVEYRREPGGWTLRLYVDKPGGVNLDDCQRLSQEFGTILEVEDPIPHKFNLEVSSPGLDRPLRKESDFVAALERRVRISLHAPLEGRKNFTGRLVAVSRDTSVAQEGQDPLRASQAGGLLLRVRDDSGAECVIPAADIERARIVYEWPDLAVKGPNKQGHRTGRKR